jgi:hypothetical protein
MVASMKHFENYISYKSHIDVKLQVAPYRESRPYLLKRSINSSVQRSNGFSL